MSRLADNERPWLTRAFAALGDALARDVLEAVKERPGITVSDLCAAFPVSRFTIMRQLNALEDASFVRRKRKGKTKCVFLQEDAFDRLASGWLKKMASPG